MKGCKNSCILPCYRDGYGVWHYSDDTHDKVYELNKQMCDLEIDREVGQDWQRVGFQEERNCRMYI